MMSNAQRADKARTAVAGVPDDYREVALQAVLDRISSVDTQNCFLRNISGVHFVFGVLLAIGGGCALWGSAPKFGCGVVVLVNFYIAVLLIMVAFRSDGHVRVSDFLPNRLSGLFLLVLFFFALVSSFGEMYLRGDGICQSGYPDCHVTYSAEKDLVVLKTPVDALYFSSVTMMTLGYGDYVPVTPSARKLVIWQLVSGALLLILGFPLLISRMAVF